MGLSFVHKITTFCCGLAVAYSGAVLIPTWSFSTHTLQPIVNSVFLMFFGLVKCAVSASGSCSKAALQHFGFLESYAGHGCLKIFTGLMSVGGDSLHLVIAVLVVMHGFVDIALHCCTKEKPDNRKPLLGGW